MRYRRVSVRYGVVVGGEAAAALANPWRAGAAVVVARPYWRPRADLCEAEQGFTVTVELAGVDPESVDVVLFEDAVVVAGERRLPAEGACIYHAAEIPQGPFQLEVAFPALVATDRAELRHERGLLVLGVPRAES